MRFNIIVATDQNGGIGRFDGSKHYIPWENSIDMKFFKDTTSITISSEKSNAVIMGRNNLNCKIK